MKLLKQAWSIQRDCQEIERIEHPAAVGAPPFHPRVENFHLRGSLAHYMADSGTTRRPHHRAGDSLVLVRQGTTLGYELPRGTVAYTPLHEIADPECLCIGQFFRLTKPEVAQLVNHLQHWLTTGHLELTETTPPTENQAGH